MNSVNGAPYVAMNAYTQPRGANAGVNPLDPLAGIEEDLRRIVSETAEQVFTEQQPRIEATISGAIESNMPAIREAIGGAITDELPTIRKELDDFVLDQKPVLEAMIDETIAKVKTELPKVIDEEVARQRAKLEETVQPIIDQQVDAVKTVANRAILFGAMGGLGAGTFGYVLGARAWSGFSGGVLGAAGLGALGAVAGAAVGAFLGAASLDDNRVSGEVASKD